MMDIVDTRSRKLTMAKTEHSNTYQIKKIHIPAKNAETIRIYLYNNEITIIKLKITTLSLI